MSAILVVVNDAAYGDERAYHAGSTCRLQAGSRQSSCFLRNRSCSSSNTPPKNPPCPISLDALATPLAPPSMWSRATRIGSLNKQLRRTCASPTSSTPMSMPITFRETGIWPSVLAPYCLHESARSFMKFDYEPLVDGQMLDLGNVKIKVLHTPGHTIDSLDAKLLNLPVDLEIFPGHQAGSACGVTFRANPLRPLVSRNAEAVAGHGPRLLCSRTDHQLSRAPSQHGPDRRFQHHGQIRLWS